MILEIQMGGESEKKIFICPNCRGKFEKTTFGAVSRSRYDSGYWNGAAAQMENDTLLSAKCPSCGARLALNYNVTYGNEPGKYFLNYQGGLTRAEAHRKFTYDIQKMYLNQPYKRHYNVFPDENSGRFESYGYQARICEDREEFDEKRLIFDAGLDDHVVEYMKPFGVIAKYGDMDVPMRLKGVKGNDFLFLAEYRGRREYLPMPAGNYQKCRSMLKGFLEPPDISSGYYVNRNWAIKVASLMNR